jgi:hypothetical protein
MTMRADAFPEAAVMDFLESTYAEAKLAKMS